jgi:hypothetical protein
LTLAFAGSNIRGISVAGSAYALSAPVDELAREDTVKWIAFYQSSPTPQWVLSCSLGRSLMFATRRNYFGRKLKRFSSSNH